MHMTKEQRAALNRIKLLRKEQLKEIEKLKTPLKEDLRLLDLTLKNQYDIRAYVSHSRQIMKYLKKL